MYCKGNDVSNQAFNPTCNSTELGKSTCIDSAYRE